MHQILLNRFQNSDITDALEQIEFRKEKAITQCTTYNFSLFFLMVLENIQKKRNSFELVVSYISEYRYLYVAALKKSSDKLHKIICLGILTHKCDLII